MTDIPRPIEAAPYTRYCKHDVSVFHEDGCPHCMAEMIASLRAELEAVKAENERLKAELETALAWHKVCCVDREYLKSKLAIAKSALGSCQSLINLLQKPYFNSQGPFDCKEFSNIVESALKQIEDGEGGK